MTSSAFPLTALPRAAREFGSFAGWFALALLVFASVLPLRLTEQHGSTAPHWIHCATLVALAAFAAIVIRVSGRSSWRKEEPVDVPEGGGWSPDLDEKRNPSKIPEWVAAERKTGAAMEQLRVQHRLRDPLHHARMIVRDLETVGGPPDRLALVRSLRAHLDEISVVGGHDVRASFAARLAVVPPPSSEALS